MSILHDDATRDATYVIAEMAWSHNGSLENALRMARGAREAGADAVGIHVTSLPDYMVRDYQALAGRTTSAPAPGSIYGYLEKLNLSQDDWRAFIEEARALGLHVSAMCNDEPSLDFAVREGVDSLVVAAAAFTDARFVARIAAAGKPLVFRVGGATLDEIDRAVAIAKAQGNDRIVLLHGIQLYPTAVEHLELRAIPKLRERYGLEVGLADHIDGDAEEAGVLPLLAIPCGASVLEKHITVDRALQHEDFEAALGIEQFKAFVARVRLAERALGTGAVGRLTEAETRYRLTSRKRAVARRAAPAGHVLSEEDVTFKRSDRGLDAGDLPRLVGGKALRDLAPDDGLDETTVALHPGAPPK